MERPIRLFGALFALSIGAAVPGAQVVALDVDESLERPRAGWLPYGFSTESLGVTLGVGGFVAGKPQPQASFFGTAFGTDNDSWGTFLSCRNLRLVGAERVFLDAFFFAGRFTDSRFYTDPDPAPAPPVAGSNDSGPDDFITGVSDTLRGELKLFVPLPIGNAAAGPLAVYRLERGMLLSGPAGGETWNPLESGRTTVATSFFFNNRDLVEDTQQELLVAKANGLRCILEHDNTDFPRNPSCGSRQRFTVTRDFGWFDSSNTWTNWELGLSKYFDLGTSGWFRQQVLAFNAWTSDSPTWTQESDGTVGNRPPPYMGATLGGFDRLRGYPVGRFSDRSAIYYSGEVRLMPHGNPLRDTPVLDYFEIDWLQVVGFFEAGRVGPRYESELFFDDLKLSAGVDLRLMAFRSVVRLGVAWSSEGAQVWAMLGQPFDR